MFPCSLSGPCLCALFLQSLSPCFHSMSYVIHLSSACCLHPSQYHMPIPGSHRFLLCLNAPPYVLLPLSMSPCPSLRPLSTFDTSHTLHVCQCPSLCLLSPFPVSSYFHPVSHSYIPCSSMFHPMSHSYNSYNSSYVPLTLFLCLSCPFLWESLS